MLVLRVEAIKNGTIGSVFYLGKKRAFPNGQFLSGVCSLLSHRSLLSHSIFDLIDRFCEVSFHNWVFLSVAKFNGCVSASSHAGEHCHNTTTWTFPWLPKSGKYFKYFKFRNQSPIVTNEFWCVLVSKSSLLLNEKKHQAVPVNNTQKLENIFTLKHDYTSGICQSLD